MKKKFDLFLFPRIACWRTMVLAALFLFTTQKIFAQYVNIPDPNFKTALVNNPSINTTPGPDITYAEAAAYTGTINVIGKNINDLTGIEAFTSLTSLDCSVNHLTDLNLSANTALTSLTCPNNLLTNLDVGSNTNLTYLDCSFNQLPTLNVSQNVALTYLGCSHNQLTDLDVSANTALLFLACAENSLTSLDVSTNTSLNYLWCNHNSLTNLDVSSNTTLVSLGCFNNLLTSLNVKNANNYNFSYFNALSNPGLTCIQVDDAAYSNTNWTNKDITATYSPICPLCNVNIPDANFKAALVGNTLINTSGDLEIQCWEAAAFNGTIQVSGLNIGDLTGIESFTSITSLVCSSNQLTSLNLSANSALLYLDCHDNLLTSLNVSGSPYLSTLTCFENQLTALNVSANTVLYNLICYNNQLTSLNLSTNTALNYLWCDGNQLASLNLSANTGLMSLYCNSNLLTGLNVSANHALKNLQCANNLLTSLNVKNGNNSNFTDFNSWYNSGLTCIEVDNAAYSNANWSGGKDAGASFSESCTPSLSPAYCGATSLALNGTVTCTTIPAATDYEYTFINAPSYTKTVTSGSSSTSLPLTAVTGLTYATTYQVTVKAKVGGVWGPAGDNCQITTMGIPTTQLTAGFCGATNLALNSTITCTSVFGASNYEFTITNTSGFNQTILSASTNLALNSVSGLAYGTTYQVKVRAKVNGVFGLQGTTCSITTMLFPATKLATGSCGAANVPLSNSITCVAVTGATNYEYTFTSGSTSIVFLTTTNSTTLPLTSVPNLAYATTYQVTVKAKVAGVLGPLGMSCPLATSTFPPTQLAAGFCGVANIPLTASISCVPVAGATNYEYTFISGSSTIVYLTTTNSTTLPLAFVSGLTYSTVYTVRVKAKVAGVLGPLGPTCSITTASPPPPVTIPTEDTDTPDEDVSQNSNNAIDILSAESTADGERTNGVLTDAKNSVYPNPVSANGVLTIAFGSSEKGIIYLTDTHGKIIAHQYFDTENGSNVTIELADLHLTNGVYMLTITGQTTNDSHSIVIIE